MSTHPYPYLTHPITPHHIHPLYPALKYPFPSTPHPITHPTSNLPTSTHTLNLPYHTQPPSYPITPHPTASHASHHPTHPCHTTVHISHPTKARPHQTTPHWPHPTSIKPTPLTPHIHPTPPPAPFPPPPSSTHNLLGKCGLNSILSEKCHHCHSVFISSILFAVLFNFIQIKYQYFVEIIFCIKELVMIWATSWENLFMPYANNKDADQPAHPRSLISVFVIRFLDSIISLVSISKISRL